MNPNTRTACLPAWLRVSSRWRRPNLAAGCAFFTNSAGLRLAAYLMQPRSGGRVGVAQPRLDCLLKVSREAEEAAKGTVTP